MKSSLFFWVLPALLLACQTHRSVEDDITYVIKKRDTNGDGRIDSVRYNAIGMADADYEFRDTDFDGRFDQKVSYGYAIICQDVNIPIDTQSAEQGASANP